MARLKLPPRRLISKATRHVTTITRGINHSQHPPTQIFTSTSGTRAELLHLPSIATPSTHVLLLPGNPGIIEYYRPTLRALHRRLPFDVLSQTSLHALGYPGHDLRCLNGMRTYGISEHVALVHDYLQQLQPAGGRIVLMGHSYGSFVSVEIAKLLRRDREKVDLVMLMPALWQMGRCAGWMQRFLLRDTLHSTSWAAWGLTALLPPFARDALVALQGFRQDVDAVTRTLLDGRQRQLFLNICALARDEVKHILEPGDLSQVGDATLLVHVDKDQWCPVEGVRKVEEAFGKRLEVLFGGEGVSHGFCLFEDQTERVVKVVAPWVCERVRGMDFGKKITVGDADVERV